MKYYLAGPMAGIAERNFPLFKSAAEWLRAQHYEIMSPAELNVEYLGKGRSLCMRRDIEFVMQCDGIFLLPGWKSSQGAITEYAVATQLMIATFFLNPATKHPGEFIITPFIHTRSFKYSIVNV